MGNKPAHTALENRVQDLEQELERCMRREQELERTLEATTDGIWSWNFVTHELYFSPQYYRMLGYEPDAFPSTFERWTALIHPDDLDAALSVARTYLETKPDRYENTFRMKTRSGAYRWIQATARVVERDGSGEAVLLIGSHQDVTEAREREDALQRTNALLEGVLDGLQDVVGIQWPDHTMIRYNRAGYEALGMSPEEVHGKKCYELIGRDAPCDPCATAEALKTRRLAQVEKWVPELGRYFLCRSNPILDARGGASLVVEQLHDVTDRRQTEERLRESENRLRSILRVAPTGIGLVADRVLLEVNDRLCGMLGYTRDELLGQSARMLYPSQAEFDRVGQEKYAQIREQGTGTVETQWQRKDGRVIDVLLSSTPLNPEDMTSGVTFTALDITERKRAEQALRLASDRFQSVLDSIEAVVCVADMETCEILFVNAYTKKHFGRDPTGEICYQALQGKDRPCPECPHMLLSSGRGASLQDVSMWEDRNPITGAWYAHHSRPIRWTDGRMVRLQIATDITEFKAMEVKLRQAQKMEAIGTLAGGIAHDFNNILSAIVGFAELAEADLPMGSQTREDVSEVLRGAHRAKDLVKQILTFSRQSEEEPRPIRIPHIAKEALKMLRSTLPTSIEMRQDIPSDVPAVLADPSQIHQVIMNLSTNAWHATAESGGVLEVRIDTVRIEPGPAQNPSLPPGQYVRIRVRDTGCGMDEATRERIFDPYFTTKEKGEGTGLGLAVVLGIVEGAGGRITVESAEGRGTTFTVYFPALAGETQEPASAPEALPEGREHILFVDDEAAIVRLGERMLQRLGYEVTSSTDPQKALALFESDPQRYDTVVTDMTMPRMAGDELARKILAVRPDVPVLLCTGYTRRVSEEAVRDIGIRALIMKPLSNRELARTIRDVLDGS